MKTSTTNPSERSPSCDEALSVLALGRGDRARAAAHLSDCEACRAEQGRAEAVASLLASYDVPAPPADAARRTLAAAAPLLARRAMERRERSARVVRALAVALLPLPLLLFVNVRALLGLHELLLGTFSAGVSLYLTLCLGGGLALVLALSYAAVPLLAARRPRSFALEERDVHVPA